ncbi:hypothetical protein N9Z27_00920 [Alphaproteobacteria bacterium]|nr:hypothetical protein [Alphaproteobacteria bacterium]
MNLGKRFRQSVFSGAAVLTGFFGAAQEADAQYYQQPTVVYVPVYVPVHPHPAQQQYQQRYQQPLRQSWPAQPQTYGNRSYPGGNYSRSYGNVQNRGYYGQSTNNRYNNPYYNRYNRGSSYSRGQRYYPGNQPAQILRNANDTLRELNQFQRNIQRLGW